MNKKLFTLLAFVTLAVSTTFAAGNDITESALETFSATFAKATDVEWKSENTYFKASFKMNNQSFTALISEEGEMIAVSRNILSTELPISLKMVLNKDFATYWISNLVEYAVAGDTKYFITIENGDQTTIMESLGTHEWSVLKKTAK